MLDKKSKVNLICLISPKRILFTRCLSNRFTLIYVFFFNDQLNFNFIKQNKRIIDMRRREKEGESYRKKIQNEKEGKRGKQKQKEGLFNWSRETEKFFYFVQISDLSSETIAFIHLYSYITHSQSTIFIDKFFFKPCTGRVIKNSYYFCCCFCISSFLAPLYSLT